MIKDSFDRSFFKSLLEEENPDKIFYCGPSNIEYTMRKLESELGINNKFYYVWVIFESENQKLRRKGDQGFMWN